MAPKVRGSLVLLENWEAQYDLNVESGEEKRLEREIGALLRIFFLYSKSIGAIESFGAKYVCVHMWREIWPIWYLQEIFLTVVLRMGWRVQEWLWGNQFRGGFAFVPVGNNVEQSWSSDGRDEGMREVEIVRR